MKNNARDNKNQYVMGRKHGKVDNLWSLHPFIASELTTCWYHGNAGANIGEQKGTIWNMNIYFIQCHIKYPYVYYKRTYIAFLNV